MRIGEINECFIVRHIACQFMTRMPRCFLTCFSGQRVRFWAHVGILMIAAGAGAVCVVCLVLKVH